MQIFGKKETEIESEKSTLLQSNACQVQSRRYEFGIVVAYCHYNAGIQWRNINDDHVKKSKPHYNAIRFQSFVYINAF